MALWKPFRGNRSDLDSVVKHDGYVYFCIDDGSLFFDYTDADGNLQRKQINAKDAETITGVSLGEIRNEIETKADLVDGKVPLSQLPEMSIDTSEFATKEDLNQKLGTYYGDNTFPFGEQGYDHNMKYDFPYTVRSIVEEEETIYFEEIDENGEEIYVSFWFTYNDWYTQIKPGDTIVISEYQYDEIFIGSLLYLNPILSTEGLIAQFKKEDLRLEEQIDTKLKDKANKELIKVSKVDVNSIIPYDDITEWWEGDIEGPGFGTYVVLDLIERAAIAKGDRIVSAIILDEEHHASIYSGFVVEELPSDISIGDSLIVEGEWVDGDWIAHYTFIGVFETLDVADKANKEDLESLKTTVENINIPKVDTTLSTSSNNAISNKAVATALNKKADIADLVKKADLVDGKIPVEQLPEIETKEEIKNIITTIDNDENYQVEIDDASPFGAEIEIQVKPETHHEFSEDCYFVYNSELFEEIYGLSELTLKIIDLNHMGILTLEGGHTLEGAYFESHISENNDVVHLTNIDWEVMDDGSGVQDVKAELISTALYEVTDEYIPYNFYYLNDNADYEVISNIEFYYEPDDGGFNEVYLKFESGRGGSFYEVDNETLEIIRNKINIGDVVYINGPFEAYYDDTGTEQSTVYFAQPISYKTYFDIYDKESNQAIICDNITDSNGYLKTIINYPPEFIGIAQMGEPIVNDLLECDIEKRVRYTVKTCSIQDEIITCTFDEGGHYAGYTNRTELVPVGTIVWMDNNNLYSVENLKDFTVTYNCNVNKVLGLEPSDKENCLVQYKNVPKVDSYLKENSTNAVQNAAVTKALNKKADLVDGKVPYEELPTMDLYLTSTDEETVDKIPSAESVRDCLSKKIEGYSSKYNVVEKGWHRVLNTIRGNPGQLYLTLTDGYSLQSLEIDLAGFVRLSGSIETPDDVGYLFCKSNSSYMYPRHSTIQSDPYFKYKITAMRMGYASQEALKEKFDPDVSAGISINSYIDVYIDYNAIEDGDKKAQLLVQFTGKGDQHHSYRIDEETTDTNYVTTAGNNIGEQVTLNHGLYGEALEFINIPIREDYDSVEEGYKTKLVDDFSVKVSDNNGEYTSINEAHNIRDISKIVYPDGPDVSFDESAFRLYRKYNLLSLFSCHSSNDFFSRYNWKGNATDGKYKGGNLIYPFRSGKKTVGGVHYGITSAGTIIFNGGDTPTSIQNINVYYSNQESTAIKLPAGTYMTNVNDLYYTDNLSAATQTKVLLSNYVGSAITNKCFKLDSPKYLTFARICVTPNHWPLDSSELGVYTPFLIKVPDDIQLGSVTNNAYTITDERWKNFSIKSSLEGENPAFSVNADGWLELEDKYSDYIIINDTYNNEVHHINKFDDFYSSWRAKGTYLNAYHDYDSGYVREVDFNKNQVIAGADEDEKIFSDNELIRIYNMYIDRSENPYDTLFMFDLGLTENAKSSTVIHHNDIKNIKDAFNGNNNSHIEVDSELSDVSENPVQNKVLTEILNRCIKQEEDDFMGEHVDLLYGISIYNNGGYYPEIVLDSRENNCHGRFYSDGFEIKNESNNSYFKLTLSNQPVIDGSDDVKQAFKNWLGISDTVVNNLVEQKLDTIAEEASW